MNKPKTPTTFPFRNLASIWLLVLAALVFCSLLPAAPARAQVNTSAPYIQFDNVATVSAFDNTVPCYRIPVLVKSGPYLIIGYEKRFNNISDNAPCDFVIRRALLAAPGSTNGGSSGLTWGSEITVDNTGSARAVPWSSSDSTTNGYQARNPNLLSLNDGTLLAIYNVYTGNKTNGNAAVTSSRVYTRKSTDNGATWSAFTDITSQIKWAATTGTAASPAWTATNIGPASGVQLSAADPVHPGRIYFTFSRKLYVNSGGDPTNLSGQYRTGVIWSDDNGVTWGPAPSGFANGLDTGLAQASTVNTSESQTALTSTGVLLISLRNEDNYGGSGTRLFNYSSNYGQTFSSLTVISAIADPAVSEGITSIADRRMVVTTYPNPPSAGAVGSAQRYNLNLRYSLNDGVTWLSSSASGTHTTPEAASLPWYQIDSQKNAYSSIIVITYNGVTEVMGVYEWYATTRATNEVQYIRFFRMNLLAATGQATLPAVNQVIRRKTGPRTAITLH